MRTNLLAPVLALAAIGCVSTGRYEDLEHRYDSVRLELGRTRGENQSLRHQAIDREATLWGARAKLRQEQTLRANAEAKRLAIAADNEQLFAELQRLSDDHDQLQQVRDRLKDSLAVLAARKSEAERRAAELRAVVDRWQSLIDAGSLSVTINDGRMVLTLPSDVLFDSGSAKLNADGKNVVQKVGSVLASMPSRRFQVEGHTDDVPIANAQFPSNWELASARALGVVRSLLGSGMQTSQLSAASYGEFHPLMPNDSPRGRQANRRIEIVLLPDLSNVPGAGASEPLAER